MTKKIAFLFSKLFIVPWMQKHPSNNIVILLEGNIGVGKTVFIKGIAKQLDITQNINSPTFVLCKIYQGFYYRLYHLDIYNLLYSPQKNLLPLHIDELLENVEAHDIVAIETTQDVTSLLPIWHFRVRIVSSSNNTRNIFLEKNHQNIF